MVSATRTNGSIAASVATRVVHRLESIDVNEGQGEWLTRSLRPNDLSL